MYAPDVRHLAEVRIAKVRRANSERLRISASRSRSTSGRADGTHRGATGCHPGRTRTGEGESGSDRRSVQNPGTGVQHRVGEHIASSPVTAISASIMAARNSVPYRRIIDFSPWTIYVPRSPLAIVLDAGAVSVPS